MAYVIREMRQSEYGLLADFLYEAIFIPNWYTGSLPRDIIYTDPLLYAAIRDFGAGAADCALVAERGGEIVGAVWARVADEYGHMADDTPSLAISLYKEHRGRGLGTALLGKMLAELAARGWRRVSLGVSKENLAALHMYGKLGFKIVGDGADATEYLMLKNLR